MATKAQRKDMIEKLRIEEFGDSKIMNFGALVSLWLNYHVDGSQEMKWTK